MGTKKVLDKAIKMLDAKVYTAFYRRGVNGNIQRSVYNDGETTNEIKEDIRGNGYSLLKLYAGDVSYNEFDEWYFMNRKK